MDADHDSFELGRTAVEIDRVTIERAPQAGRCVVFLKYR
jgi:hypothetical protein